MTRAKATVSAVLISWVLIVPSAIADLIVLAAPGTGDAYYADVADAIFGFHVEFANRIGGDDRVLVLTDEGAFGRYADALGADKVARAAMADIWVRDFGAAVPDAPVMFRYTAAGQGRGRRGQAYADAVQEQLVAVLETAGLRFGETDLLNDGGNVVDGGAGRAVISRKFLRDNGLGEDAARAAIREVAGLRHVAFIDADEQGGLEHADGVVSFIDANVLMVNAYPGDPAYARQLKGDLKRGLPDVDIHDVVTPYDATQIYDERFGSACGLYTNALVTATRIYLPQFGIPEDQTALAQVRAATSREVIPVLSGQICHMGGGVRCMSWQVRGENAARLLKYFSRRR